MSQKEITKQCDCCGVYTNFDLLSIVCPHCLHQFRNEKQKELLFNMDWEEDENGQNEN